MNTIGYNVYLEIFKFKCIAVRSQNWLVEAEEAFNVEWGISDVYSISIDVFLFRIIIIIIIIQNFQFSI